MNIEKPLPPQLSEEEIHHEQLKHRERALEQRVEFEQALEQSEDMGQLIEALRRYAFVSHHLYEEGELVVPGFTQVFPEYRGKDEFGVQKNDYAIDTEHPLDATLDAIQQYNRGEIDEYRLYQAVGIHSPTIRPLERLTGVTLDDAITKDIERSKEPPSPPTIEGEVLK